MPIEQVVTKSEWEADKFIPPIEEKIAPEIGVYSTGKRTATHTFKKPIRKVAVIGAGPAGVCNDIPTKKTIVFF
jgi:threonine dehydrogenase-like Zn-dependent dehydrogenase